MKLFTPSSLYLALSVVVSRITAVAADRPATGKYYIVNGNDIPLPCRCEEELALTFNGQGQFITVAPLSKASNQTWLIDDYPFDDSVQTISPDGYPSLEAAFGAGSVITVIPGEVYVWRIDGTDSLYSIQDGDRTVLWTYDATTHRVATQKPNGSSLQSWTFIPA